MRNDNDNDDFRADMGRLLERTGWIENAKDAFERMELIGSALDESHAFRGKWALRLAKEECAGLAKKIDSFILRYSLEQDVCFIVHALNVHEARLEVLRLENFYKSVLLCIELTKHVSEKEAAELKASFKEARGMDFEPGAAFTDAENLAEAAEAEYRRVLARFQELWPERVGPEFQGVLEKVHTGDLAKVVEDLREKKRRGQEALAKLIAEAKK